MRRIRRWRLPPANFEWKRSTHRLRRWWLGRRAHQVWRAILRGQHAGASVLLVMLTLAASVTVFVLDTLGKFGEVDQIRVLASTRPGLFLGLSVPILALVVVAPPYLALRYADPAAYAALTVAGRPVDEALRVLSFEIHRACWLFREATIPLDRLYGRTDDMGRDLDVDALLGPIRANPPSIERRITTLRKTLDKLEHQIARLQAMKHVIAAESGIPIQRLCRYIVQYSPRLHRIYAHKYCANWDDLLQFARTPLPNVVSAGRVLSLVRQNERIHFEALKRMQVQEVFLSNGDLLGAVHAFASQYSSSGALLRYAQALSRVASRGLERARAIEDETSPGYGDLVASLRFLHAKQRAYPGAGIHSALLRLLDLPDRRDRSPNTVGPAARSSTDEEHAATVAACRRVLRSLARRGDRVADCDPLVADAPSERVNRERARKSTLKALRQLGSLVENYLEASRDRIAERFTTTFLLRAAKSGELPWIVTRGYSRTVREVLKRANRAGGFAIPLRVFVLKARNDPDVLESQRMIHELTEDPHVQPEIHVSYGDESLLVRLIGRGARMIVLVGAEVFDAQLRVYHARGTRTRLRRLKNHLRRRGGRCTTVVVAEEFKHAPDGLLVDAEFMRHHIEGLTVLPGAGAKRLVDYILTEDRLRAGSEA